jgi:hypothetical protein
VAQLSASVADYAGRTVDMLAFDDAKASGDTKLTQLLVQPKQSGALTTGIQKLAQRFLIELLTEKGSLEYLPERGTFFITQIRAGIIRTSQDLFTAFSSAELELRNNLRLEDNINNDPTDEQYQSATLTAVSLFGDMATLTIDVKSAAGTSRQVIYPLRVATV